VQLVVDATTAIVQLSDPEHFNTFSSGLGEDTRLAMSRLQALPGVASVVLQGTGAHFSAGGNPWSLSFGMSTPAASTASLRELYAGFVQLRALPVPIICGVHGTVIGGGVAACMHADCLVAERSTRFEHGNLVRGVCPLGMLSRTFVLALGRQTALAIYLQNAQLDAPAAVALDLCSVVVSGVEATQAHARGVARASCEMPNTRCWLRAPINAAVLASEASWHAECQMVGGGMAKSSLTHDDSMHAGARCQQRAHRRQADGIEEKHAMVQRTLPQCWRHAL